MRVGRDEAIDLFSKWISERTLLECTMSLPILKARFRARLSAFEEDTLKLASDDTFNELALTLTSGMEFEYGDARLGDAADEFEGILVVVFRRRLERGGPDFIAFSEVKEPI